MRKIPKSFEVFGKTFTVKTNSELGDFNAKGRASEQRGLVELDIDLKKMSEVDVEVTYMHEVVHIILDSIAMDDLSKDEQFVELLSRALHQYLITSDTWKEK